MRLLLLLCVAIPSLAPAADRPNLVLIVADDLGYGDMGCYGSESIPTPRLDQMAAEGIRMTRAYAPASTCTPTRFSIMTGEYPWRPQKRSTSILDGDAPLAIEPGRPTLPQILGDSGYRTALVGKWHLGIGDGVSPVDFNGHVGPGPMEVGFGSAFYIPATVDRVPCVFIDDHEVADLSSDDPLRISYRKRVGGVAVGDDDAPELRYEADGQHSNAIVNHISRIGFMAGGRSAWWTDEDITDLLLEKARSVIQSESDEPYFMMLGLHDPHVPHAPHPRFEGKSGAGIRGDSIVQLDWLIGEVLDAIDAAGQGENTLVMFTSDNGPIIFDGYFDGSMEANGDHQPSGPLRGKKYSAFEGGCRVPTLVRWKGRVEPGVSDELLLLTDLLVSFTSIAGVDSLPDAVGRDGVDASAALLDAEAASPRTHAVLQGIGKRFALVTKDWKFAPKNAKGNPGRNLRGPTQPGTRKMAGIDFYADTLLDLNADPGETRNVLREHPEVASELKSLLADVRAKKPE